MPKDTKVYISQNVSWTIHKGSWLIHFIITFLFWVVLVQLFGHNVGSQLTVILYNIVTFIFFHWIVGDPFDNNFRDFTFWEQMAEQLGQSSTLIFMSVYPVILFMVVSRIVVWKMNLFCIAVITLALVVIPKLGFMHMKRVFGIRRHD